MLSFLKRLIKRESKENSKTAGMNKELIKMQSIPADKVATKTIQKTSSDRLTRYNSPIGVDPKAMAKAAAARIDAIEKEIALDLRGPAVANIGVHPKANQVANRMGGFNRIKPPGGGNTLTEPNTVTNNNPDLTENNTNYTLMPEHSNTLILGDTNFNDIIEVKEVTMAPAVEEAAILYANGQLDQAINVLLSAFNNKQDLGNSEFNAYRILFDLLRYKGDAVTFEHYATEFAIKFEKSPPDWELPQLIETKTVSLDNVPILDLGEILDASIVPILEQLKVIALHHKHIKINVGNVSNINYTDGFGCELLMRVLNAFENTDYQLELVGIQHLFEKLNLFIQNKQLTVSGHVWLLYLEILRIQNQQTLFEEVALKFSTQYELSPPSWRSPTQQLIQSKSSKEDSQINTNATERSGNIQLSGEIRVDGSAMNGDALINHIANGLHNNQTVVCDCRHLILIEFEVVGRLLTALTAWSSELKMVEFKHLSNPIATLFVILGIQHLAVVERRRDT